MFPIMDYFNNHQSSRYGGGLAADHTDSLSAFSLNARSNAPASKIQEKDHRESSTLLCRD
jgi:hypothetical protein